MLHGLSQPPLAGGPVLSPEAELIRPSPGEPISARWPSRVATAHTQISQHRNLTSTSSYPAISDTP
jgi:hypothetical protein